ncbi:outer membrane lipoprotein carrier protein LolA [Sphingomonas sp. MAH-20]|uniref:Outer membrane lipoprotein carrier protein LolA n=1 Tax=Sphingomonas horti TaxID=2682842 RepID=A0A6I4IXP2_9SPHN|nr:MULTISPECIES: outer membrane lipoprotein carrier protein LolA [Sphingomonas]MBA2920889.1 outer membrane lipoprotein carrier protein LolA [Sphingomonas sp. CGMCC 1.13658]MVO76875.1 outer membrane lipoprotein carrier protein LolA [Sphingomonas horti]
MFFRPVAVALTSLALAAPAYAQPSVIRRVQEHLRGVHTMTADFMQTDRKGKSLTGKLYLKQPGKIRFQYEAGVPILVVGDGRVLNFIDYQVKQVSKYRIGGSPLDILLNPKRDLSRVAKVVPSAAPGVITILARDPRHPQFGSITLAFTEKADAPGGLLLEGWVALDAQNNRTTVRLSNQRLNVPVAETVFQWDDPRPGKNRD